MLMITTNLALSFCSFKQMCVSKQQDNIVYETKTGYNNTRYIYLLNGRLKQKVAPLPSALFTAHILPL